MFCIDLDTFYVLKVCDIKKCIVIQGIYLGKSDLIENTQLHEMYDIRNGVVIDFLFQNSIYINI